MGPPHTHEQTYRHHYHNLRGNCTTTIGITLVAMKSSGPANSKMALTSIQIQPNLLDLVPQAIR